MNVILNPELTLTINNAKLVVEDGGSGTIQFTILGQPVSLNLDSSLYSYDINLNINDRVKLIEPYGAFDISSEGIVQEIIPDYTQDRAKVLFDKIYPEQILKNVEAYVKLSMTSILVELPLSLLEKIWKILQKK